MKVPQHILDVFNTPHGFDRLFEYYLSRSDTQGEAYERAVEEIRKYAPNCKIYAEWEVYRQTRAQKITKSRETTHEVPKDVLNILGSRDKFSEMYWKFYRKHKNRAWAFNAMMEYINKWLPNYRPYTSSESFRVMDNRRYKKRNESK